MSGLITITEIGPAAFLTLRPTNAPCRECASDKSAATALQGAPSPHSLQGKVSTEGK